MQFSESDLENEKDEKVKKTILKKRVVDCPELETLSEEPVDASAASEEISTVAKPFVSSVENTSMQELLKKSTGPSTLQEAGTRDVGPTFFSMEQDGTELVALGVESAPAVLPLSIRISG